MGRDSELGLLVDRLVSTPAGATGPVLVAGEPGIGKTRLLVELSERADSAGRQVVWGRSWDEVDTPPFWMWTQVVRHLSGVTRGTDLADLVLDEPEGADRFELFDATADVIRQSATDHPVVIVLDDLHAADAPSLLLARFVVQQLAGHPVGLVGSYRPIEARARVDVADHIEALARDGSELRLGGLDIGAVGELLGAPARAAEVHGATGGNPLFVEQVARIGTVGSSSPITGHDGTTTVGLRSAIATRVERLDDSPRRAVAVTALLGGAVTPSEVADLLGADSRDAEEDLEEVVAAGLLHRRDDGRLDFSHSLVTETAADALDEADRARLHRRAADLIGDDSDRIAQRAQHLLLAGNDHRDAAVAACRRAAEASAEALAYEDAVGHYRRALRALDGGRSTDTPDGSDTDRERLHLLLSLGRAQRHSEERAAADATFDRAGELAGALGDAEGRALAALRGGIQYYFAGERVAVLAAGCREALDGLPPGDSPLRARLLAELAAKLVVEPEVTEGRALAAEAVAMARRTGDPVAIGHALIAEQVTALGPDTLSSRLAGAREVVAIARSTGEPTLGVHGRFLLMGALLEQGDVRGLDAELANQSEVVDQLADRNLARFALWFRGARAFFDGRSELAEEVAEQCLALSIELDDPDGIGIYGGQLGVTRWMQGRLLEMEPIFEQQRRENPDEPLWPAVLALVWASHDRPDAARGALADLVAFGEVPDGMHWLLTAVTAAEAAARVGDDALVAELWERLLPYADRFVPVGMGAAAWGSVARPLGLAALHLGHVDEGLAHLERAIEVCARMGARPWLVEAQLDLAFALLRNGRNDDPRLPELLDEALSTARQLGLARFVEQAEGLRAQVGSAAPDRPVPVPAVASAPTTTARPTVSVLGAFEVTSADGRVARWTSRKARELLKILVARRGAPVHREVLMDLLWPDVEPATLGNRLSVALSTVRRALDPDRSVDANELVAADRTAVRLRTDRVDVDVERFLTGATRALDAHALDRPGAWVELVGAMRAHRGDALPDEPYAEWASPIRAEVRTTHLRVVRTLAGRAVDAGDHLAASDAFRRLVEADPFDEEVHRELVSALERIGADGQADAERRRYDDVMGDAASA
ncbi:hypothetical protein BH23ACT2_BH23ACT2_09860 [soil metagenome]